MILETILALSAVDYDHLARTVQVETHLGSFEAFAIIGNRTNFKGQSQLAYRVPSEDPMCSPKGNFYHYHWQ